MNTLDALLAAIIDRPDDDTPRLAYADELDDQARDMPDPAAARARAEFIRVQCELTRVPAMLVKVGDTCRVDEAGRIVPDAGGNMLATANVPNPVHAELRERERELLTVYHAVFWADDDDFPFAGSPTNGTTWARGFIEGVTVPAARWLEDGDAAMRQHPVRRVRLTTWPEVAISRVEVSAVTKPDGDIDLRTRWTATAGGRADVCALQTTIHHREAVSGGVAVVQRIRQQHDAEVQDAQTPLGYMRLRWPKITFAPPPRPDDAARRAFGDMGDHFANLRQESIGYYRRNAAPPFFRSHEPATLGGSVIPPVEPDEDD